MKIKILTYNIHKGFNIGNTRFVLAKIKESIRLLEPDFVFLQEVQGQHNAHHLKVKDYPSEGQFEFLADTAWPHHTYGKNAVYPKGHHGNAILSKYPIKVWHNLDLTLHRLEQRGLLHAQVQIKDKTLHLLNTHINLFHSHRRRQVEMIRNYIKNEINQDDPIILAGDFNDWHKKLHKTIIKDLEFNEVFSFLYQSNPKTFPSFFPLLPLDRIYYKNVLPSSATLLKEGPWHSLSDHLALYAELSL